MARLGRPTKVKKGIAHPKPKQKKTKKATAQPKQKQPWQLWNDTTGPVWDRVEIGRNEDGTAAAEIRAGNFLAVKHSNGPNATDWCGRAEGFRMWSPAISRKSWEGKDVDVVRVRWYRKIRSQKNMFDYDANAAAEEWMAANGNTQGEAWSFEKLWSIRSKLNATQLGKSFRITGINEAFSASMAEGVAVDEIHMTDARETEEGTG